MDTRKPYNMTLRLADDTRLVLDDLNQRLGLPKTQLVRRLFDWFVAQPEEVRLVVLGAMSEETSIRTLRRVLAEMEAGAGPSEPGGTGSVAGAGRGSGGNSGGGRVEGESISVDRVDV